MSMSTDPTITIAQLLMAFVVFGNFSAAYKHNPLFRTLGAVILGFATANALVDSTTRIWIVILQPLLTGNLYNIPALLIGSLFFCFFSYRLIGVYRTVLLCQAAVLWGLGYVGMIGGPYKSIAQLSSIRTWSNLFDVVFFSVMLLYFIFSEKLSKPISPIRKLCNWTIIIYFGLGIAIMWARFGNNLIGWTFRGIEGIGLYVGFAILAGIVIDALVGWNKILGREK